ncbi:hypothetical protein XM75_c11583 [Vibrio vulnificus]|nr:hypothetical protein XM75_c11583 [Vibrio vulnificus]
MISNDRSQKASSARQFKFQPNEYNAALRCERRLVILERSETAKRCESLLNALLALLLTSTYNLANQNVQHPTAYL